MDDFSIELLDTGLLLFTIERPDKRNAVNYSVMDGLELAICKAKEDPAVKALAITGRGDRAFCSGGDLAEFHELKTEAQALEMLSRMGRLLYRLAVLPVPTLALMNGAAMGGGLELACACDFRIGRENAQYGFIQGTLAITTGWGGASLLMERISHPDALYLLMDAGRFTGKEMKERGLFQEAFAEAGIEHAHALCRRFYDKDKSVLSAYKDVLVRKWKATGLESRMARETERCAILWEQEEHHRAVARFLEK